MNRLFERFVVRALREALGADDRTLSSGGGTTLDERGRIRLEPDLSWWPHGTFVGDVKYKRDDRVANPDLYQLLAYATAFDLPGGLLIYAGKSPPDTHLSGSLPETLACVEKVAARIRQAAGGAGRLARPA